MYIALQKENFVSCTTLPTGGKKSVGTERCPMIQREEIFLMIHWVGFRMLVAASHLGSCEVIVHECKRGRTK